MKSLKIVKELFTWISSAGISILIALFISMFLFQPTKVIGSSMEPTLQNDHRIYVSKLPRIISYKPKYGDIVIIDSRVERKRTWKDDFTDSPLYKLIMNTSDHNIWVKRVIGKEGDVLQFKDGKIYRNNILLEEPYIKETMQFPFNQTITVPKNAVFVMGDNRNNSKDSREIGCVPTDHVLGTKLF